MRGVFDGEEVEQARPAGDTELTLTGGMLLAILAGLVLVCALCFGMGYAAGHNSAGLSPTAAPQPAPDQEPLQASGAVPKPSAIEQTPVDSPPQPADTADPTGAGANAGAATSSSTGAAITVPLPQSGAAAPQPVVHAALPAAGAPQSSVVAAPIAVHPAVTSQPAQQFLVQIAAVSNPQDANVLVDALKKRNYPVTSKREPADNLIHVRMGPFVTHALADEWRMKLLNDGYNAIIQP